MYNYLYKLKELYYLRSIKFSPFSSPGKVFIGFQNNKNSGGGLKLRDLKKFDSNDNKYNVLYLLSSSLPESYGEMITKARKANSKIIWNQNGIGFAAWAGPKYMELNESFKFGLENADVVIFQSKFAQQSVDDLITNTTKLNKMIIYNAIDTSVFKPDYISSGNSLRILVAGSHHNINRVVISISIILLLRQAGVDCSLNIAGKIKGSSLNVVKALIKQNHLLESVNFLGEYGRLEAPGIFSSSDILLHLQPFDPCPTVVIEAMASGLVVIGPNNGGIPELVGEELSMQLVENFTNYSEYEWGKPEDYAKKINSLIPILDELKSKARCRAVEHFDITKWVNYHSHLFGHH